MTQIQPGKLQLKGGSYERGLQIIALASLCCQIFTDLYIIKRWMARSGYRLRGDGGDLRKCTEDKIIGDTKRRYLLLQGGDQFRNNLE